MLSYLQFIAMAILMSPVLIFVFYIIDKRVHKEVNDRESEEIAKYRSMSDSDLLAETYDLRDTYEFLLKEENKDRECDAPRFYLSAASVIFSSYRKAVDEITRRGLIVDHPLLD